MTVPHRLVAIAASLVALCAGTPAAAQVVTIPATPAGAALREWLDAFNSGDSARFGAYLLRYEPDLELAPMMGFREQTGGFDLVSVERSAPRAIEFVVRERKSPMTGYGVLTLGDGEPPRVQRQVRAMGPGVTVRDLRIDAAARRSAIEGAVARLDSFYVFPEVAKRAGDTLRARLARGAYDAYENGLTFATRLDDDLAALTRDKHLHVNFSPRPIPARPEPPESDAPRQRTAAERAEYAEDNCGFQEVKRLPGNIGYLRFDYFGAPDLCEQTAAAAMTFLAGTKALIVDLRQNGGGSPPMVAFITSYLFDGRTHLNDLWTRRTNKTEEFWTRDSVPGLRFGGKKPVYVLTSKRTFSGAEEFSYNLKALKRATIVGEVTGGGAHPVAGHRIDEHFFIGVPFARAINPVTKTNWEGTGVEPDVQVPAKEAQARAEQLARGGQ
jgi:hypothetical protein